ncbi:ABC-type branched-chain amino acid transport system, ATPase component [Kosakonia oryzendophytica]|uniref:ABC-type branched-chain amino acid transport system, ATPase component n=1 Tax=Kosakonia oryzendophytica TaxID=1005665 RepID=A0A1C4B6E1_9ENTR|nr:ATP-binding cassette domain-containing protein [Kosakonia oryzendophytica]AMO48625.1 ABC transporter related [Enterobacter sp. FY-07]TDT60334.1 ABC-type branched-subunit amino acid transport system ATPase component [Enterobacter sp. AG5470]WBT56854.1 ATP-binding cassette domain-containing protein [Kosakonia oryzendophytica]SCC02364.1 ABC-type branched-chain amino acid transport system, ATPase component [Kosakonia oryzendophytica]
MLSLRAVNQYYGNQHTLWNIDLDLTPGACTSVIGLPGMGKTTLINCITGYLPVESGSMIWQEAGAPPRDLLNVRAEHRCAMGMGYVPQDRRIFSQLTVEENLHIAMMAGGAARNAVSQDIYDLFPELYTLRKTRGAGLSEDNQQQLAMARALVTHPRLLILDEPTRGLGQAFVHKLGNLIVRLNQDFGITILLAEQQLAFIRRVADRFCLLHRGRSVAEGEVKQLDDRMLSHWMTPDSAR